MKHRFFLRPEVRDFTPYSPGLSIDEIMDRYNVPSVIKMASNENPLGTSPLVQQRICSAAGSVFRYAQSGNPQLIRALAKELSVPDDSIVLGNGSDEVIDLLIRACPIPGEQNVVACNPCFSLYKLQSRLCGVEFRQVPLLEDFSFDWSGLEQAADSNTAIVFLTTPDNPSGYCPPKGKLESFVARLPETALLVIDEAYMDFCDAPEKHSLFEDRHQYPNVVFLRTFSKSRGLAGIRLGYGVMNADLAQSLCSIRPPFSVNILAEIAGIAALEDTVFYRQTLKTVWEGRHYLHQELMRLGCSVAPSQANFLMFRLPAGSPLSADATFAALLKKGVILRPLTSYALPQHLRISVGTQEENSIVINLLTELLHR